MTTIVQIDGLLSEADSAGGVRRQPIATDGVTMLASLLSLAPGASVSDRVPPNSDGYWFVIAGSGAISEQGERHEIEPGTFAIAQEGAEVQLANSGVQALDIVYVISPPPGSAVRLGGYCGPLQLLAGSDVPLIHEPENKKRRAFFVGPKAIATERAEGMIVHYESETVTRPHFHPDADSLFVILDGALEFTNGREVTSVSPGQAVFINQGHRHGTKVVPGHEKASFLEFHVPAKFQTIQAP